MKNWTKRQIDELAASLDVGVSFDDSEAFDIADGVLATEQGLKESIEKVYEVSDALGWLANRI